MDSVIRREESKIICTDDVLSEAYKSGKGINLPSMIKTKISEIDKQLLIIFREKVYSYID